MKNNRSIAILAVSGVLCATLALSSCGDGTAVTTTADMTTPAPSTTTASFLTSPVPGWNESVNYLESANHTKDHANRANEQGWKNLNEYLTCTDPTYTALLDNNEDTVVEYSLSSQEDIGTVQTSFSVQPKTELKIYAVAIRYTNNRILDESTLYGFRIGRIDVVLEHLDLNDSFTPAENGVLLMPSNTVYIELNEDAAPHLVTSTKPLEVILNLMQDGGIADMVLYGDVIIYP